MVSSRKRTLRDVEDETKNDAIIEPPKGDSLLHRIRNMWQFANLFQFIFFFGKVFKIDDSIDIDVLEIECLKSRSPVLVDIGLAMLKHVSSHRGLTPELFDEYTRRQYVAKAPEHNPFGTDEMPASFHEFDISTKLKVLQQLTRWVMLHPERIREKVDEQRPTDQTTWRIEPYGWDSEDRAYYLLDDDRLYRMTDAPSAPPQAPEWKPKRNTIKAKAAARAAKRRRVSRSTAAATENMGDGPTSDGEEAAEPEDDGLGGAKWECIATDLEEVQAFLATIRKSRDDNEKVLRRRIEQTLLPILEKHEESRKRKALARERELLNMEKMAHAKRSSRIAGRAERQRAEDEARAEDHKRRAEETAAKKEEAKQLKMERDRDNRLMSRENRLKEREARRIQHEEELAQLSEDSKNLSGDGTGRVSERRLQAEIERNKQALKDLKDEEEEEDWFFDCVCGMHGHVDDGTHSIACEKCNVWQHSKCAGVSEEEADREDFHFICNHCKEKAGTLKPFFIKLKVKDSDEASSPPPGSKASISATRAEGQGARMDAATDGSARPTLIQSSPLQPVGQGSVPVKQPKQTPILPPPTPYTNGQGSNPFSSPHPTLSPPQQSPNKSRAYHTISSTSPIPLPNVNGEHKSLPPKGVFRISPKTNGQSHHGKPLPPSASPRNVSIAPVVPQPNAFAKEQRVAENGAVPSAPPAPLPSAQVGQTTIDSADPSTLSTPELKPSPGPRMPATTPTLPPVRNGVSPLKRSPPPPSPVAQQSTPALAVLPPTTALSPSPSQQIMTPPVKPTEAPPLVSQSSNGGGNCQT